MSKTITDIVREMRRRALDFKGGHLPADAVVAAGEDMELFAERIEAAERNATMLCHQVCSCEILAKMETENERLRAMLKPVLDVEWHMVWNGDGWNEYGDPLPSRAVREAQRIYREVAK